MIRFAQRLEANPFGVYAIDSPNSNYQDTSNQSGYFRQLVDDTLAGSDLDCNSPAVIRNKDGPGPFVSAGSYEQFVATNFQKNKSLFSSQKIHAVHLEKN